MKKFVFGIIVMVVAALVFGAGWNLNHHKEHGFEIYQKELAERATKIEELEDSIRVMQAKIEFYDEVVKWFRNADDEELERNIKLIRSFPRDAPLP